jgi:uncharacterized protein YkwD
MKRLVTILFFFVMLATPAIAPAQEKMGESTITEGLRDKGTDWLKDKAKEAGEDWIFDTGQSETMHEILVKARERADGEGNDKAGLCQGAVMGKASSILNDINYAWTARSAGKLAFDTVTKMAALASGFGGAAAEGGALDWLAGQYADAAKGAGKDAVFDKIKNLFGEEKKPEVELYEDSGKSGDCDYKLRAAWDIVHGTYYVYIAGDCHCAMIGNAGVAPRPLGEWWISFEGHLTLVVDKEKKTATWVPQTPKIDFDAQCACSGRALRKAFSSAVKKTETSATGVNRTPTGAGVGGGTTSGGTLITPLTPPPLPPSGRKVCEKCQSIQDKIDADTAALAADEQQVQTLAGQVTGANGTLGSAKGKLEAVKASPQDYTISPDQAQQQVNDAQAEVDRITRESARLEADQTRLKNELRDLAKQLEDCIKKHCPENHSSAYRPTNEQYAAVLPRQRACEQQQLGAFAATILSIHNSERAAVGAPPLCWNAALASDATAYAQELARTGELVHATREGRGGERENLQKGLIGWGPDRLLRDWTSERRYFHAGTFPSVCGGRDWSECAHYTQMIWPTTTDVGCGVAPGRGFEWLVCRYSPGGNRDGEPVGTAYPTPGRG